MVIEDWFYSRIGGQIMENIKKLYIEAHKEDIEPKNIRFENLGYFFDIKSGIGVQKKYI